jgi:hypothetical protein
MWVMKVASYLGEESASNKPRQAGEFSKPDWRVRITKPPLRQTPHATASPIRSTRSKRINSRLNERELATLQRRGCMRKQPNRVSGTRATNR